MRSRVKTKKTATPALDPALAFDNLAARALPPVLTVDAVIKGLMPPLGLSAMPASLEAAIPPGFRFWKAATPEDARACRDELVERGIIEARDILKVDGELRRVVWSAHLAIEDAETDVTRLIKRTPVAAAGPACLIPDETGPAIGVLAGELDGDDLPWTAERTTKAFDLLGPRACIALSDTPANRAALAGAVTKFSVATRPGVIFGSGLPLDPSVPHAQPLEDLAKNHAVRLLRKAETEERFVLGIVLEPDVVDSQNDTYDEAEVRKAAHRFMEHHAQLGLQHSEIVTGKLKILESYVTPVEFSVGEEVVKKGTWVLGIRLVDDDLWVATKSGSYTGFSIGGTAIRSPIP